MEFLITPSFLVFQECPWLHAHEDSPQRRSIHPGTVQQSLLQHSRNDPPLLHQQAAHQGGGTHVPALPSHRPAPITHHIHARNAFRVLP